MIPLLFQLHRSPIKKVRKSLALDVIDEDLKLTVSSVANPICFKRTQVSCDPRESKLVTANYFKISLFTTLLQYSFIAMGKLISPQSLSLQKAISYVLTQRITVQYMYRHNYMHTL